MANEYKLSYTASEIDERLGKIDNLANDVINTLAENGQIGSSTKPVYTYDGDPNNLVSSEVLNELYGSPMTFIKVSDVVHDLNTIVFAKAHTWAGDLEYAEFDLMDSYKPLMAIFGFYHPEDGSTRQGLICMAVNEEASAMTGLACGTYLFVSLEDDYYPTYIEFAEAIKTIDPKYLPEGGFGYTEIGEAYVLPETTITITDDASEYEGTGCLGLEEGKSYTVIWDGAEYECKCVLFSDEGIYAIGNLSVAEGTGDTGEPFIIADVPFVGKYGIISLNGNGEFVVSIRSLGEVIYKIDSKYLPAIDNYIADDEEITAMLDEVFSV